jgi:hypothetical protein
MCVGSQPPVLMSERFLSLAHSNHGELINATLSVGMLDLCLLSQRSRNGGIRIRREVGGAVLPRA